MTLWKRKSSIEVQKQIFESLKLNVSFEQNHILGVPASCLDRRIFYPDAPFLKEAPFLMTLRHNPNHIGCHTLEQSENFFPGTQALEREVIRICAEDIMKGAPEQQDGYIASGGTEANIQAIWTFRNYFQHTLGNEASVGILSSEDTHYSVYKAGNLLNLPVFTVKVCSESRKIKIDHLKSKIAEAKSKGIKQIIVVANMMTTMFGSVDDVNIYIEALKDGGISFKIHVDAAFGGFLFPFSSPDTGLNFSNPYIDSITLDAHKMLQAPYGTGIFLIRKGLIKYTRCTAASYVQGLDSTLCGSRSGANAIAVWMILMHYGPEGWVRKVQQLLSRTNYLCQTLDELGISYFRQTGSNIISIQSNQLPHHLVKKYLLVPDNHSDKARWFKIVVMDHVDQRSIDHFLEELSLCMVD